MVQEKSIAAKKRSTVVLIIILVERMAQFNKVLRKKLNAMSQMFL
jgi:hypothetical protein